MLCPKCNNEMQEIRRFRRIIIELVSRLIYPLFIIGILPIKFNKIHMPRIYKCNKCNHEYIIHF